MLNSEPELRAVQRKAREQAFHDVAFTDDRRRTVRGFYRVVEPARRLYDERLDQAPAGAHVVEFGCGRNASIFRLARRGCRVTAIDISEVAIDEARTQAAQLGLSPDRARFERMDAENLLLEAASADLVCGTGILHHLNLGAAAAEIHRVLRPGGSAVFVEPLGHNPGVSLFRKLTPSLRTPDEHPLMMKDLELLGARFADLKIRYVGLLALLAAPLVKVPGVDGLLRLLHRADAWLFGAWPWVGRHAWACVIELRKGAP